MGKALTPEQANALNNAACTILSNARSAANYASSTLREARAAERAAEENLTAVQKLIAELGVNV